MKWDKPAFKGRQALLNEKQQGVTKRFVTLTLDAPGDFDALAMPNLWRDGRIVGETTSGGWGFRTEKSIALGMLRTELAEPGQKMDVEIFGEMFAATVQPDRPLWDPENERLRS